MVERSFRFPLGSICHVEDADVWRERWLRNHWQFPQRSTDPRFDIDIRFVTVQWRQHNGRLFRFRCTWPSAKRFEPPGWFRCTLR